MDQRSTIRLLNETFSNTFDIGRFTNFVKELFNHFTVNQRDCTKYIAKEYQEYIASFEKLGDYENSKKEIEVLIVGLNKTSSRDRARTMQRNFIANWLGKTEKDAALVAFYGEDPQDWRFSFVKMEYQLVKDTDGKVKILKELTPAKRYSFLVGKNEPNHTCRKQFLKLVMEEEVNPSLDEIESAFSIENVTKEFFLEYKDLYLKLKESLEKVLKKDKNAQKEFEEKNISTVDFAKKLLGQIVFIYFLQKKGWLGVDVNGKWGDGPKDFMRRLFGGGLKNYKPLVPYKNFFNEILEPLFYEALATDRSADDHYYRLFKCKIPFLNGGLFEPINEYNWSRTDILLDNSIFDRILSTFDRFNFTVKEDEPLEKEVAVDPEMLGKVFENLLEIKDRKSTGRYYTPREIVHYMCQQSLINYLETNISIPRKDIEKFIQFGNFTTSNDSRVLEEIKVKQDKLKKGIINTETFQNEVEQELDKLNLPKSIIQNKEKVDRLLREIKIVDPAVGSGAFPVGMLNEIVKARVTLGTFFEEKKSDYELKREIIENCLYGVDIDSSAVDITKLRFWLSLIVDELDIKNIKPLPNLDHKIMCGNSLLEEFEGIKLFDEKLLGEVEKDYSFEIKQIDNQIADLYKEKGEIIRGKSNDKTPKEIDKEIKKLERKKGKILSGPKSTARNLTLNEAMQKRIKESKKKLAELKKLQERFFDEQNRKLKKQLRADIDKIEWELIEETLKEQGNLEAMQKLEQYKKNKAKPFFLWKLYFAEVFQRDNPGFDVVIANPPYVDSETMVKNTPKIREIYTNKFNSAKGNWDLFIIFIEQGLYLLRKNGAISYITPNKLIGAKYSETLRGILIQRNIKEIRDYSKVNVFKEASVYPITFVIVNNNEKNDVLMTLMDSVIGIENKNKIPKEIFYSDIDWARYFVKNKHALDILIKFNKYEPLMNYFPDISGAATVNEAYEIKKLVKELSPNLRKYKKFINTGTVDPFVSLWGFKKTNYIKQSYEKPIILDSDLGKFSLNRHRQACSEKIIIGGMTKNLECFYDTGNYLAGKSTTIILPGNKNLKFVTAILNSKLISFWYGVYFKSLSLAGGFLRIGNNEINKIPIVDLTNKEQTPVIKLVDQILSITKADDYLDNPDKQARVKKLEMEIDQLVYKLYGLTKEEIKIVEEFGGK